MSDRANSEHQEAPAPLTDPQIETIVRQYRLQMARYEATARAVGEKIRRELRAEARLRHLIAYRAKHPTGVEGKLERKRHDARYAFSRLEGDLNDVMTDLAGVRVLVYALHDEERVVDLICRCFALATRPDAGPTRTRKDGGYRATHILVLAPADGADDDAIRGAICEVQVTTVAQHLFNEVEHDIAYKDAGVPPTVKEQALLTWLAAAAVHTDGLADEVLSRRSETIATSGAISSPESLRFTFEQAAARPLSGDFVRLFGLLERLVAPLHLRALREAHGEVRDVLERGESERRQIGVPDADADDTIRYALGVYDQHKSEIDFIMTEWTGRPGPLKRALALAALRVEGRQTGDARPMTGGEK